MTATGSDYKPTGPQEVLRNEAMNEETQSMRSNSHRSMPTYRLRWSRRAAGVAVVQTADHGHADNRAKIGRLHVAMLGAVSVRAHACGRA